MASDKLARQQDGTFPTGKSGNPRGRPRGSAGLAKMIRERTNGLEELFEMTYQIAKGQGPGPVSTRDRIAALQILFDRALGKPMQPIDMKAEIDSHAPPQARFDPTRLTDAELDALTRVYESALVPAVIDVPSDGNDES